MRIFILAGLLCLSVPTFAAGKCLSIASSCSDEGLCETATYTQASSLYHIVTWSRSAPNAVKEAKRRNLSCGVGTSKMHTRRPYSLDGRSNKYICGRAVPGYSTVRKWRKTSSDLYEFVVEAKKRGLTCGVGSFSSKPVPVVKAPTKPVPVIKTPTQDDQTISASSGSGFAVSTDGYVITNNHVIEGCQDVVVHTKQKDIPMRVITYDTRNDLALLKGDFTPSAVFPLSTRRPELLQDIYVAGYPFGINISTSVKVTKGIISSLTGIGNNFSNMQIDAALQSGNSGGPILDDMGNLVGVAVAKLDAKYMMANFGSIPENTNFGIKSSVVKSVLDSSSVDTPSANKSVISKSQLGKMITDGTYYISCWMTMAQIEKVRSKKVLFSEFD